MMVVRRQQAGPLPRRDLRLYLDRVPDADRNADHGCRVSTPVGFCRSLRPVDLGFFAVVTIALLVSCIVAVVLLTP